MIIIKTPSAMIFSIGMNRWSIPSLLKRFFHFITFYRFATKNVCIDLKTDEISKHLFSELEKRSTPFVRKDNWMSNFYWGEKGYKK